MSFVDNIKLFFSNKEIIKRILVTLLIVFVFRVLSKVPAPGIEKDALEWLFGGPQNTASLFNIANILAGGTLSQFSIVSIGLFSYISASVIFQLLTPIVPKINELRKMGEVGTKILDQWTRILTVFIAGLQSYLLYFALKSANNFVGRPLVEDLSGLRILTLVFVLTAGTMLLVWLAELCSEYGLGGRRGGGVSVIISAGILASLPTSLVQAFSNFKSSDYLQSFWITFGIEWLLFVFVLIVFFLIVKFVIFVYNLRLVFLKRILAFSIVLLLISLPAVIIFIYRSDAELINQFRTVLSTNISRLNDVETRFAFYLGLTLQIISLTIFFNESVRKIPIKFVNKLSESSNFLAQKVSFMPLKLLSVGVMPVIFASSLLLMPEVIYRFLGDKIKNWDGVIKLWGGEWRVMNESSITYLYNTLEYASLGWLNQASSVYYHILHFIFTVLFSMFFIYILLEPDSISNSLKRLKAYIIGVRPGEETINYISYVILRMAFWGGIVLGFISSLPFMLGLYNSNIVLGIESLIAGGTSVLILVPTILSITTQIKALMINKNYDKFEDI